MKWGAPFFPHFPPNSKLPKEKKETTITRMRYCVENLTDNELLELQSVANQQVELVSSCINMHHAFWLYSICAMAGFFAGAYLVLYLKFWGDDCG